MNNYKLLTFILSVFLITGCGVERKIQYIPVDNTRIEYISKIDTTIIRDSVFVDKWRNADTVYLTKEKYKYITKIQRDTIHLTDTVSVIKEVEIDKPYVPEYYRRTNTGFWVLLSTFILLIGFRIWRKVKGF